jgi:hypothetical protein
MRTPRSFHCDGAYCGLWDGRCGLLFESKENRAPPGVIPAGTLFLPRSVSWLNDYLDAVAAFPHALAHGRAPTDGKVADTDISDLC